MSPRDLWACYRQICCVGDSFGVKVPEHFAVNAAEVRRIPAKTPWESRYQASSHAIV